MESSTSLEIGALGKLTRPSERLRDDDGESFGASRTTYASRRKMQMRLAARIARDRTRGSIIVLPKRDELFEIFEGLSRDARELGIRSYQVEVAERESFVGKQIRSMASRISVSLAYVSILGDAQ